MVRSPPARALRRCDSGVSFLDRPMPPSLRTPPPMTPLTPLASDGDDSYSGLPMNGAPARCGGVAPVDANAVASAPLAPPADFGVDELPFTSAPLPPSLPRLACLLSARSWCGNRGGANRGDGPAGSGGRLPNPPPPRAPSSPIAPLLCLGSQSNVSPPEKCFGKKMSTWI